MPKIAKQALRKPKKKAKVAGFVVGRAAFTKISAVEGIHPSPPMKKRITEADSKKLSAADTRKTILQAYRKA